MRIPSVIDIGPAHRCEGKIILDCQYENPPTPELWSPRTCGFFLYIRGQDLGYCIVILGLSCHDPLHAIDPSSPMDYRAGACIQVSVGSSTVLAPSSSRRYQVGLSRHALFLSRFFMLQLDVLGKPRFTYEQGSTAVLVCRSLLPSPPGVLHPRIEICR